MSPEDPVTTGELGRRVAAMESRMDTRFDRVESTITSLAFVSRDRYEAEHRAQNDEIRGIRRLSWAIFTLLGTALVSVGAAILARVVTA